MCYNGGLLWSNSHLFVISDSEIKQFDASSGSLVSERPVPGEESFSCIAIPNYGQFIAHSAHRIVTFWDMSTHTHLGLIQYPQNIRSIALSHDDRFLAIDVDLRQTLQTASVTGHFSDVTPPLYTYVAWRSKYAA
jgi:WD40 repeat protein